MTEHVNVVLLGTGLSESMLAACVALTAAPR